MNDESFAGNSRETTDFIGNKWKYDCMGCAIRDGIIKVPGGIIYEGKYSILAADPEIPIPGFLIVNSKRHVNSFSELEDEERHEIIDIVSNAEKALKEQNITKEVTIVQEERSKHLHVWIFPNREWMNDRFGKGIKYLRDISEYAKVNANENDKKEVLDTIEKIKNYFKKVI